MSILYMSLSTSITQPQNLSFSRSIITTPNTLFLHPKLSQLSLHTRPPPKPTPIRMGGGPRTFPGGVSKWQWKRMQAKKAKQLLKARLCRERQIYEMRKRAELKAAVAELEKPWEVVERAPTLFSVKADEQLKVLADRFQRAGGFDMWSEKDGPQLFDPVGDDLPSARFFPKGVVHSKKPYQRISGLAEDELSVTSLDSEAENGGKMMVQRNGYKSNRRNSMRRLKSGSSSDGEVERKRLSSSGESSNRDALYATEPMLSGANSGSRNGKSVSGEVRKKGSRQRSGSLDSKQGNANSEQRGETPLTSRRYGQFRRGDSSVKLKDLNSEVFDMSLKQDGSYGF